MCFNPRPTYRLGAAYLLLPYLPYWFQSSPNLSAGRSRGFRHRGFNPHSTYRPGADGCGPPVVSILTQPIGRVQRAVGTPSFQSSSNLSVECMEVAVYESKICFNPHPNLSVGCSRGSGIVVSILTQTYWLGAGAVRHPSFQSSPNLSVGCNLVLWQTLKIRCFNPHRTSRLGAVLHWW